MWQYFFIILYPFINKNLFLRHKKSIFIHLFRFIFITKKYIFIKYLSNEDLWLCVTIDIYFWCRMMPSHALCLDFKVIARTLTLPLDRSVYDIWDWAEHMGVRRLFSRPRKAKLSRGAAKTYYLPKKHQKHTIFSKKSTINTSQT